MATPQTQKKPVVPNFKDVNKEAVARARGAVQGGKQDPLTPPEDARTSEDNKGKTYVRWTEQVTITAAYTTVTKKGLTDVVIAHKIRQSEENSGKSFFAHFYYNNADEVSEGHQSMNDKSNGSIITLLEAVGLMPTSGELKASLLMSLFPVKNKPGSTPSKLIGKTAIANMVQQHEAAIDEKTGKPKKLKNGETAISKRDGAESYLPDVASDEE